MKKVWIFFKLRLLQLRYDKTALFFSYFLPVILLTGIGYPMEMASKKSIEVHYSDRVGNDQSKALVAYLNNHELLKIVPLRADELAIEPGKNPVRYSQFLEIAPAGSGYLGVDATTFAEDELGVVLSSDDSNSNKIQGMAVGNILDQYFETEKMHPFVERYLSAGAITSYIVTLLPGLIGMTLLTIGLNGFGGVLIVERDGGLFKNIKTIDASPVPFLAGLFFSRLFICYTVAAALYAVGVLMFGLSIQVDYLLLWVMITLGCISFLGIGLVIAVFSKSVNGFNGIVNFVNIPFVVFSGVFFSTAAFPGWLQAGTQLIPLTHMNSGVRMILFDHVGIANVGQISKELIVLSLWCAGTVILGLRKFKW